MLDVMVPKAALTLSAGLALLAGGWCAADATLGPPAALRRAPLHGPATALLAALPIGLLVCFPGLSAHPWALGWSALGPIGALLAQRSGIAGVLGGAIAAVAPAAALGALADASVWGALSAGLHGAVASTFVGALLIASRSPTRTAARRAAALGLAVLLSGALRTRVVGVLDPIRVSALRAQWEPAQLAPVRIVAVPRELDQKNQPEGVSFSPTL